MKKIFIVCLLALIVVINSAYAFGTEDITHSWLLKWMQIWLGQGKWTFSNLTSQEAWIDVLHSNEHHVKNETVTNINVTGNITAAWVNANFNGTSAHISKIHANSYVNTTWLNVSDITGKTDITVHDDINLGSHDLTTTGTVQGKKVYAIGAEGTAQMKVGPSGSDGLYFETPFSEWYGEYSGKIYLKHGASTWAEWYFNANTGATIQDNAMAGDYYWNYNGVNKMHLNQYGNLKIEGDFYQNDNEKHYFGTGNDASIYYDGTDLIVNPREAGSGGIKVKGDYGSGDEWLSLYDGTTKRFWIAQYAGYIPQLTTGADILLFLMDRTNGEVVYKVTSGQMTFQLQGGNGITHRFRVYNGGLNLVTSGEGSYPGDIIFSPDDTERFRIGKDGNLEITGNLNVTGNTTEKKHWVSRQMNYRYCSRSGYYPSYAYTCLFQQSNSRYIISNFYVPEDIVPGSEIRIWWDFVGNASIPENANRTIAWKLYKGGLGVSSYSKPTTYWNLSTGYTANDYVHWNVYNVTDADPNDFISILLYRRADYSGDTYGDRGGALFSGWTLRYEYQSERPVGDYNADGADTSHETA